MPSTTDIDQQFIKERYLRGKKRGMEEIARLFHNPTESDALLKIECVVYSLIAEAVRVEVNFTRKQCQEHIDRLIEEFKNA